MSTSHLLLRAPAALPLEQAMNAHINSLGPTFQYEEEELTQNSNRVEIGYRGAAYLDAGADKDRTYALRKSGSLVPRRELACSVSAITKGGRADPRTGNARYPEPRTPHVFVAKKDSKPMAARLTTEKLHSKAQPGEIIGGVETQADQITVLYGRRKPVKGQSTDAFVESRNDTSVLRPSADYSSTSGRFAAGRNKVDALRNMVAEQKARDAARIEKRQSKMGIYSQLLSTE